MTAQHRCTAYGDKARKYSCRNSDDFTSLLADLRLKPSPPGRSLPGKKLSPPSKRLPQRTAELADKEAASQAARFRLPASLSPVAIRRTL
ncbi:hypothetical protein DPX16_0163 [Anabarilius grahami]|uniref:Uncharacterized protein n=1 Tax=Anabarilius grahami TaxID=495550 RepID=A0A3N0YCY5_ANAGA|nr:hypothetical protein DPX16_0163 [Anabarilius grahami]